MSKRFRIVKRISKENTGHFEDIEVDDDFVDNEMVQIIADNEYDPLYDDCESIAVALQLAGYGKVADLEAKLAECEKSKESYRLQNEHHHLQLLQFYSRLGVEAFGADIHEKALETLMIMKEELAEKDLAIENWQTMYESVVQTCHNDKEEIERLNKQLAEKDKEISEVLAKQSITCLNTIEKAYQDKISFCIEQLNKVKGLIANHTQELWTCENDDIDVVLYEEIDKQINELKGKVE